MIDDDSDLRSFIWVISGLKVMNRVECQVLLSPEAPLLT